MSETVWWKDKKAQNHYGFELLFLFDDGVVEPQRIELWSREDKNVLSTCLVDFGLSGKVRQATA